MEEQQLSKYKFSVIMAIYNVEKYLEQAIESVINQTIGFKENIQLVLVNDGSPDNCHQICKKYEEMYPENVIYIKKENGGVSSARNMGLDVATGSYINFLDSDDYFSENCFEEVQKLFEQNDVNVVAVNLINFEDSEGTWINGKYFKDESQIINMDEEYNFMQCQVGASFIKNEYAKRYRFDEKIKIHEDSHYLYRIFASNPKCGTIGKATYWHRIRKNRSSATQNINHQKNMYDLTKLVFNSLIKFYKHSNYKEIPSYLQTFMLLEFNYYVMNNLKDNSFSKKEMNLLKKEIKFLIRNININNINNHFALTADEKDRLIAIKENIKNVDMINKQMPYVQKRNILKTAYLFTRKVVFYIPKRIMRRILRPVLIRLEYLENSNVDNDKLYMGYLNGQRNEYMWNFSEMTKQINNINENTAKIENNIDNINQELKSEIEESKQVLKEKNEQLETDLNIKFSKMSEELEGLEKNSIEIKEKVEKINTQINEKTEKLNTELNEIKKEIGLNCNDESIDYCLYFHNGSNNHGCEAIIKSLIPLLNADRDKVLLHSFRKNEDVYFDINKHAKFIEEPTISNQNEKIAFMGNCAFNEKDMGLQPVINKLNKNAVAISIGGDNYCYGEYVHGLLKNYNNYFNSNGIRTALVGCSIETELLENPEIVKDLEKYSLILARETTTYNALIEKGIKRNTHLAPDPAFTLSPMKFELPKEFIENNTIGINISPLVMNSKGDLLLDNTKNLINYIIKNTKYNIMLIPHVTWEKSNDLEILGELYNEYYFTGRIGIISNRNCQQLKYAISKCRAFIGARTHSVIAAYSTCVPAIAIGYSMKAKGIAKDIFGTTENYVIEAETLKDKEEFTNLFVWLEKNYNNIKNHLNNFMPKYVEKAKIIPEIIKKTLEQPIIRLAEQDKCTGCTACYNICPNKCITMKENDEGFKYPVIDLKKCTHCNLCAKVCPANNNFNSKLPVNVYAVKNKDDIKRKESSSGGVFVELAEYIIEHGGIVFGATYKANNEVEHIGIQRKEDIKRLQGSKYVQSNLNNCYKEIKDFLKKGKLVLFTGVPCQIQGLKSFLNKNYENLICVDVICHGVPSPKIFEKYILELEKENNSKIKNIDFRYKQESWKNYKVRINFKNGKQTIEDFSKNIYMRGFLRNIYLRKSCYQCMAKALKNESDITIGDYWGIQNIDSKFDDDKGCSAILINTIKGNKIFEQIKNKFATKNSNIDDVVGENKLLINSVEEKNTREQFFKATKETDKIKDEIEKQLGVEC